ncbi:11295_t:CDS:10, partial [Diversispora eburnea]
MSQQKKKPYVFKSYFAWASERDVVPSLSEFVQLNTDFVARSSTQTSDLQGLEGAWAKRFDLTAKILILRKLQSGLLIAVLHSQHCEHSSVVGGFSLGLLAAVLLLPTLYISHPHHCAFLIPITMHLVFCLDKSNSFQNYEIQVDIDNADWSCIIEKWHMIQISENRREKTYTMYSNENEYIGNKLLEDQKKSELNTRLTKRFLECAKGSPPKRVAKEAINDSPNNPFTVSGIPGESNSNDSGTPDERKANHSYDWFTGPGIKKSELSEGAKKWVIGTLDVSNLLLEYRDMSIQKASDNKIDEIAEILSLNHIFLFEQNVSSGISLMIEPESLKIISDNIKNEFTPYQMSDDDILRCYKMAKTASEDFEKCKSLLRKWQKELDDDQEDLILEIFESMQVFAKIENDTFVHEVFEPVIKTFFRNINFKCEWSTDVLEASAHRKRKFDPSLQGRKADFSVYMPIKDCDLVKLGNEMKDILDKCIDNGVGNKNMTICGFQCRLFAMDLKYEAIYRMILLGKFYLPRDNSDLGVLPTSIERLMQIKTIMTCSTEICRKDIQNLSKRKTSQRNVILHNEMTRPSFHTPIK